MVDIKTGEIIYGDIVFASKDENISNINIQFNVNGEPVNIEGFTFIANIQKPDTLKTPVEVIITDPENGLCILDLPLSLTIETGLKSVGQDSDEIQVLSVNKFISKQKKGGDYMFEILDSNHMRIVQGDTAIFDLNISDYNFVEGDVVYFTVKKSIKDKEYTLQKVVTEFNKNTAKFKLSKEDTNIRAGNYIYDIQVSLQDGRVDTIVLPSKFEVLEGVTNE